MGRPYRAFTAKTKLYLCIDSRRKLYFFIAALSVSVSRFKLESMRDLIDLGLTAIFVCVTRRRTCCLPQAFPSSVERCAVCLSFVVQRAIVGRGLLKSSSSRDGVMNISICLRLCVGANETIGLIGKCFTWEVHCLQHIYWYSILFEWRRRAKTSSPRSYWPWRANLA